MGKLSGVGVNSATAGLLCTIFVDRTKPLSLDSLQAVTNQDCTGSFRSQWTQAQFANDKGGWHRVTGSIVGPRTTGSNNDTVFWMNCRLNPVDGRRNYRLEARGYAIASNGVQVSGALQYGRADAWVCL